MKILFIILLVFVTDLLAEPYMPINDELVLSVLPEKSSTLEIIRWKRDLAFSSKNTKVAFLLSNHYLQLAKELSDPRYYGLAENILKPWWEDESQPKMLLLQARILEHDHQFLRAIAMLNKMGDGQNQAQVSLMKANIYQVLGRYEDAKNNCEKLLFKTSALITAACYFSIDGFTASSNQASIQITKLQKLMEQTEQTIGVNLWVLGLTAEVASLTNHWNDAERMIIDGLSKKEDDIYLLSLYADLLLKQGRYQKCVDLLLPYIKQTTLLVRFLVAVDRLPGRGEYETQKNNLELRIQEDEIKSDERHLREYAYYQLYVKKDYQSALDNALINWNNQKELIDSLILYRAAQYLDEKDVLKSLSEWRKENRVQINFDIQSLAI